MDCYYGCDVNDFRVPKDQDLLDWHPLPESWSNWGISAPEGFDSPKQYFTMDRNASDLEFDFMEESFGNEVELEHSLNDKDQSTSSSFQQTLSSDQRNYELQGLSCLVQMGDIFLDSVIDDLSCVEEQHNSFYFCPENPCSNAPRGLQKDIEASKFVPNNLNSKECLDIECNRDEAIHEQYSNEESILQNLEMAIAQFTGKTRICFRDALYRLARDTKHVVENLDAGLNMQTTVLGEVINETMRSEDNETMESDTNSVDRAVANLVFNKMETNIQDLPLTTSIKSNQEINVT